MPTSAADEGEDDPAVSDPPSVVTAARDDNPEKGPSTAGRIVAVVLSLASVFLILQAIGAALEIPAEATLNKPTLAVVLFGGSGISWAFAARGFWKVQGHRWICLATPFLLHVVVFWIARSPL